MIVRQVIDQVILITLENRLIWLLIFPFRVIKSHLLDLMNDELQLNHRLFTPQSAVLIKSGDTFLWRHEVRRSRAS